MAGAPPRVPPAARLTRKMQGRSLGLAWMTSEAWTSSAENCSALKADRSWGQSPGTRALGRAQAGPQGFS